MAVIQRSAPTLQQQAARKRTTVADERRHSPACFFLRNRVLQPRMAEMDVFTMIVWQILDNVEN